MHGNITISGTSVTPSSGVVSPLTGIPLNGIGQNLGVWNLESTPLYVLDNEGVFKGGYMNTFFYEMNWRPELKVKVNPALNKSVSVSCTPIIYNKYEGKLVFFGGPEDKHNSFVYSMGTLLYSDSTLEMRECPSKYIVSAPATLIPDKSVGANTPAISYREVDYYVKRSVVFKVVATVSGYNGVLSNSSKSFIPTQIYNYSNSARPVYWTYDKLRKEGWL